MAMRERYVGSGPSWKFGENKLKCDQKMSTQVGYVAKTVKLARGMMGINEGTLPIAKEWKLKWIAAMVQIEFKEIGSSMYGWVQNPITFL